VDELKVKVVLNAFFIDAFLFQAIFKQLLDFGPLGGQEGPNSIFPWLP
jgi:hypothetical protein